MLVEPNNDSVAGWQPVEIPPLPRQTAQTEDDSVSSTQTEVLESPHMHEPVSSTAENLG